MSSAVVSERPTSKSSVVAAEESEVHTMNEDDYQFLDTKDAAERRLAYFLRRPIAFHPVFIDVAGNASGGIFLSQLFYWADKGRDNDGWIFKSAEDWRRETRLTYEQQRNARKTLIDRGVIEEKRMGMPAQTYHRIVWPAFARAVEEAWRQMEEDEETGRGGPTSAKVRAQKRANGEAAPEVGKDHLKRWEKTTSPRGGKTPDHEVGKDQIRKRENPVSAYTITESTSESTSENCAAPASRPTAPPKTPVSAPVSSVDDGVFFTEEECRGASKPRPKASGKTPGKASGKAPEGDANPDVATTLHDLEGVNGAKYSRSEAPRIAKNLRDWLDAGYAREEIVAAYSGWKTESINRGRPLGWGIFASECSTRIGLLRQRANAAPPSGSRMVDGARAYEEHMRQKRAAAEGQPWQAS